MDGERRERAAVDAPRLLARLDGDRELLAELREIFAADAAELLQALDDAIAAADAGAVHRAAHTLKGAVGNFCAARAHAAALALETAGRESHLEDGPALLEGVRSEIEAVLRDLARLTSCDATPDADRGLGLLTRTSDF